VKPLVSFPREKLSIHIKESGTKLLFLNYTI
jgi:hypothetical protein